MTDTPRSEYHDIRTQAEHVNFYGREMRHRAGCDWNGNADHLRAFTGSKGDPMVICRLCGMFKVIKDRGPQPVAQPAPVAPRLVCRDHGNPVTHTGSGCEDCATERAEREARHRDRRKTTGAELGEWWQR